MNILEQAVCFVVVVEERERERERELLNGTFSANTLQVKERRGG